VCNPPPSLRNAHRQADTIAPNRHWDPETDGICGDPAHASRQSDHNPDSRGVPHAVDVDDDPQYGYDASYWAEQVRLRCQRGDEIALVVTYIISDGRIASRGTRWNWTAYVGSNAHVSHAHYSIARTEFAELWAGAWWEPANNTGGFGTMTDTEITKLFADQSKQADARFKALEKQLDKVVDETKGLHNRTGLTRRICRAVAHNLGVSQPDIDSQA